VGRKHDDNDSNERDDQLRVDDGSYSKKGDNATDTPEKDII
jgi:hypothetical protein